jgi:hypothetical protein
VSADGCCPQGQPVTGRRCNLKWKRRKGRSEQLLAHLADRGEATVELDPLSPCLRGENAQFHLVSNQNLLNSAKQFLTTLVSVLVSTQCTMVKAN